VDILTRKPGAGPRAFTAEGAWLDTLELVEDEDDARGALPLAGWWLITTTAGGGGLRTL